MLRPRRDGRSSGGRDRASIRQGDHDDISLALRGREDNDTAVTRDHRLDVVSTARVLRARRCVRRSVDVALLRLASNSHRASRHVRRCLASVHSVANPTSDAKQEEQPYYPDPAGVRLGAGLRLRQPP